MQLLLVGSGPTLGTSVKAVSTELGLGLGEDLAGGMTLRLLLPGALEGAGAGSSLPPEPAGALERRPGPWDCPGGSQGTRFNPGSLNRGRWAKSSHCLVLFGRQGKNGFYIF